MLKRMVGIIAAIIAATLLIFHAETCPAEETNCQWVNVTRNAAYAPRDGAGALVFNGKMWLIGGWDPYDVVNFPESCNSEVWSSEDGLNWQLVVKKAPWEGRHSAGYVVHQGKMWILGGDHSQGHYQKDVWCSANGKDWELVTDDVPWGQRVLHYTVVHEGKIWVMGGQTLPQFIVGDVGGTVFFNDVWCSEDGMNWTRVLEHAPWSPRGMIGGGAVLNGRIWLMGGGTYDTPDYPTRLFYNDVWSTADGVNWVLHTEHAAWHPRQYHDVAAFDGGLWVMEGWNNGNRNDVWYSADGVNWNEVPNTPWAPRHAASVYTYDNALWMVAGNNMQRDVWKLVGIDIKPVSLSFGYVHMGSTKDLFLTVKDKWGGTLTGNATTTSPFSIVSGGSYDLGPGQSQDVTVRYQPTSQGPHTGTIVFTGGGGATVQMTGKTELGLPWMMLLLGN
jgi:hypothetical protein